MLQCRCYGPGFSLLNTARPLSTLDPSTAGSSLTLTRVRLVPCKSTGLGTEQGLALQPCAAHSGLTLGVSSMILSSLALW